MELNLGQWIVIGICALLILGYIRGYFYNRRRAAHISAWLLEGMEPWGPVTRGGKLPGMVTGGRLEVQQAAAPLRRVEAVFLLAPRENPLFWIFYRLQGKRDELIVWVTFHHKPEQAVEIARQGDRQFVSRLKAADKPSLSLVEAPPGLQMAIEEKKDAATSLAAGKVQPFVQRYSLSILRLALRANKPHLFLKIDLKAIRSIPAVEFFTALSELGK